MDVGSIVRIKKPSKIFGSRLMSDISFFNVSLTFSEILYRSIMIGVFGYAFIKIIVECRKR